MRYEHALSGDGGALSFYKPNTRRARLGEKGRDPYDGLRPWSAITHGVGAVLGVAGTIALLLRCVAIGADGWHVASFLIYGVSMIALYTASTLYHCVNTSVRGRIALRKFDHCSIYFLIAGSYTPVCLVPLRESGGWGWALFGVIWALTLAGLVLTLVWISAPRWLTSGVYLFMGWLAVVALYPPEPGPARPGFLLAGAGGRAVHGGRCALRRQVARAEQPLLRLPRDLPCLYPPGEHLSLPAHVPSGGLSVRQAAPKAVRM